jgi:acyl-coenzyme A synthetase/AMP-(fatty) acid ligase
MNHKSPGEDKIQECPAPSTFEYLEYRARNDPDHIALATPTRRVTYLSFYQDAKRFSIALNTQGVTKGSVVVIIANSDIYVHWLLLIACENNGAISVSCPDVKSLKFINFLNEVDFLITDDTDTIELAKGSYSRIDADWLNKIFGMILHDNSYHFQNLVSFDDAQRITHSSGTTGGNKAMILKRKAQEEKMRFLAENLHPGSEDCLLITMPFSVNSSYLCATHFLRLGLLIVYGPIVWALQKYPITYLEILPIALGDLLKEIPDDFIKPKQLSIKVIGAPYSSDLKEKCLLKICTEISGRYATNEVWPIAYGVNHEGVGILASGVHVKILDDLGMEVAEGNIGQIAVKSSTMIEGYYKNDGATAKQFIDGYLLTGDLGRLLPSRKLQVLGRCDDLINLGGIKLSPEPIEAKLKSIDGVVDLAVTSIRSDQLMDDFCVAVLIKNITDRQAITRKIMTNVSLLGCHRVKLKFIDSLPKTKNGKLSRKMLRQMFING